jgi:hypothetical protein
MVWVLNKAINTLCGTGSDIEPGSHEIDSKKSLKIIFLEMCRNMTRAYDQLLVHDDIDFVILVFIYQCLYLFIVT